MDIADISVLVMAAIGVGALGAVLYLVGERDQLAKRVNTLIDRNRDLEFHNDMLWQVNTRLQAGKED